MRLSSYSAFLNHVSALIGVEEADLQTPELTFLNTYFNKALRDIWERSNWTDLCPYGEVRFPSNLVPYPNDLTQSNWTIFGGAVTSSAINNPLDNRVTASKFADTSGVFDESGYSQTFTAIPNTSYALSGYFRPNGINNLIITLGDGVTSWTASVNALTSSISTTYGCGLTTGLQLQANGFYYWSLSAQSVTGALNGQFSVVLSPDGVTSTYTGSGSGCFFWGNTLSTPNSTLPAAYVIPWEQAGESAFDVVYECWTTDPGSFLPPYRADYVATPNGIELIGPTNCGPIYTYYRYRRPFFYGSTYTNANSYSSGTTVYYTSTVTGESNYYTSTAATTAGQSPDTNPTLWTLLQFPYVFFEYVVYSAYADYLEVEGQTAKAQAMRQTAQMFIDNEFDRQERQQGNIQPWKVYTHLTSQNRGLGYVGQNFNAGTATIN